MENSIDFGAVKVGILGRTSDGEFFQDSRNFFMAKSDGYLEAYEKLIKGGRFNDVLEIGIFRGGSIVYFDQLLEPKTLVGIDYSPDRLPALDLYITESAKADINLYFGIDQASADDMNRITDRHFPEGIDLVIDDASHHYGPSKASFDVLFQRLRPGGLYIVEDWNWAEGGGHACGDAPDCTRLLLDIINLHVAQPWRVAEISYHPGFFAVRRGSI